MNNNPLISVITPFLNAEKYITECINSVIAQTYSNWELLLIDDGSTDNSSYIAKKYSEQYPSKIRYLEHRNHANLGKSTSRNLGISHARGGFITFLDSDDIFLPDKLNDQLEVLFTFPEAAMVYGLTEYWYDWEPNPGRKNYISKLGIASDILYYPPLLAKTFLKKHHLMPCVCSLLISIDTISKLGGFDESIQDLYEDQVLIYKICLNKPVIAINKVGEKYRQHSESSTSLALTNKVYHPLLPNNARLIFLRWMMKYISGLELNNPDEFKRILHRQIKMHDYRAVFTFILPIKNIFRKVLSRLTLSD